MIRPTAGLALLCIAMAGAPPRGSQEPSLEIAVSLGPQHPHEFSSVDAIRPLSDGRVVVVDRIEKSVSILDWSREPVVHVGRTGPGPAEYQSPFGLLAAGGDSTLVFDAAGKYLLVAPGGAVLSSLQAPQQDGFAYTPPRTSDAAGRVYVQLRTARPGDTTQAILRWNPRTNVLDTAALIARPSPNTQQRTDDARTDVRVSPTPFAPRDDWGVFGDGRILVAHPDPFSVEVVGPGAARTRGATIPHTRRAPDNTDKRAWIDAQGASRPGARISKPGDGVTPAGDPRTVTVSIGEPRWPDLMPPFTAGAVLSTGGGLVWIVRTRMPESTYVVLEGFDARGARVRRIGLPSGVRVLGVSGTTVYLARVDDQGLQYMQRYRIRPASI